MQSGVSLLRFLQLPVCGFDDFVERGRAVWAKVSCSPATHTRSLVMMSTTTMPTRTRGVQVSEAFWCVTRTHPSFWAEKKIWEIGGGPTHIRGPILIVKTGHQCRLCVVDRIS